MQLPLRQLLKLLRARPADIANVLAFKITVLDQILSRSALALFAVAGSARIQQQGRQLVDRCSAHLAYKIKLQLLFAHCFALSSMRDSSRRISSTAARSNTRSLPARAASRMLRELIT